MQTEIVSEHAKDIADFELGDREKIHCNFRGRQVQNRVAAMVFLGSCLFVGS